MKGAGEVAGAARAAAAKAEGMGLEEAAAGEVEEAKEAEGWAAAADATTQR